MVVVCAAVVAGPASSGTISNLWIYGAGGCDIISFPVNSDYYKEFTGSTWDNSVVYNGTLSAPGGGLVELGSFDAICTRTGDNCSFGLRIRFDGTDFSEQAAFGLSLDGTAPVGTAGTFGLEIVRNVSQIANESMAFSSSGGVIDAGPLTVVTNHPGGIDRPLYSFQATARLSVAQWAPGASISLSEESFAITYEDTEGPGGVPEPGSALLLLGGFAMMEFLRRKVRGYLAGLPLANAAFTTWLRERAAPRPASRLAKLFSLSDQLKIFDANFHGAARVPFLVVLVFLWFHSPGVATRTGFDPRHFPVEAAAAVDKLPPSSRLMSSLSYGGYLIYRLEGRRKIFVDGRIDYYGPEPHWDAIRMLRARTGWEKLIEKYRFTHALVENSQPLSAALRKSGWRLLHYDPFARLYEKP